MAIYTKGTVDPIVSNAAKRIEKETGKKFVPTAKTGTPIEANPELYAAVKAKGPVDVLSPFNKDTISNGTTKSDDLVPTVRPTLKPRGNEYTPQLDDVFTDKSARESAGAKAAERFANTVKTQTSRLSKAGEEAGFGFAQANDTKTNNRLLGEQYEARLGYIPKNVAAGAVLGAEGLAKAPGYMIAGAMATGGYAPESKRATETMNASMIEADKERKVAFEKENKDKLEKKRDRAEEIANSVNKWFSDWDTHKLASDVAAETQAINELSETRFNLGDLAQNIGQMLPSMAAGAVATRVGGATAMSSGLVPSAGGKVVQESAEALAKGAQTMGSLGTMFGSVYGRSFDDAMNKGLDVAHATDYAFGNAAVEIGTELFAGGIPGMGVGVGTSLVKRATNRVAEKFGKNIAGTFVGKAGAVIGKALESPMFDTVLDMLGEGVEEAVSEYMSPFIDRATGFDPDSENATASDLLSAAFGGALLSAVMTGTNAIWTQARVDRHKLSIDAETGAVTKTPASAVETDDAIERHNIATAVELVNRLQTEGLNLVDTEKLAAMTKGGVKVEDLTGVSMRGKSAPEKRVSVDSRFMPKPLSVENVKSMEDVSNFINNSVIPSIQNYVKYNIGRQLNNNMSSFIAQSIFNGRMSGVVIKPEDITPEAVAKYKNDKTSAFHEGEKGVSRKDNTIRDKIAKALNASIQSGKIDTGLFTESVNATRIADDFYANRGDSEFENSFAARYDDARYYRAVEDNGVIVYTDENGNSKVINFLDFAKLNGLSEDNIYNDVSAENSARINELSEKFNALKLAKVTDINAHIDNARKYTEKYGIKIETTTDPTSETASYSNGVLTLNLNKVSSKETAAYAMSHELVHSAELNGEKAFTTINNLVKEMMKSLDISYEEEFNRYRTDPNYDTDAKANFEVDARFISNLGTDLTSLMEVAENNPEAISQLVSFMDGDIEKGRTDSFTRSYIQLRENFISAVNGTLADETLEKAGVTVSEEIRETAAKTAEPYTPPQPSEARANRGKSSSKTKTKNKGKNKNKGNNSTSSTEKIETVLTPVSEFINPETGQYETIYSETNAEGQTRYIDGNGLPVNLTEWASATKRRENLDDTFSPKAFELNKEMVDSGFEMVPDVKSNSDVVISKKGMPADSNKYPDLAGFYVRYIPNTNRVDISPPSRMKNVNSYKAAVMSHLGVDRVVWKNDSGEWVGYPRMFRSRHGLDGRALFEELTGNPVPADFLTNVETRKAGTVTPFAFKETRHAPTKSKTADTETTGLGIMYNGILFERFAYTQGGTVFDSIVASPDVDSKHKNGKKFTPEEQAVLRTLKFRRNPDGSYEHRFDAYLWDMMKYADASVFEARDSQRSVAEDFSISLPGVSEDNMPEGMRASVVSKKINGADEYFIQVFKRNPKTGFKAKWEPSERQILDAKLGELGDTSSPYNGIEKLYEIRFTEETARLLGLPSSIESINKANANKQVITNIFARGKVFIESDTPAKGLVLSINPRNNRLYLYNDYLHETVATAPLTLKNLQYLLGKDSRLLSGIEEFQSGENKFNIKNPVARAVHNWEVEGKIGGEVAEILSARKTAKGFEKDKNSQYGVSNKNILSKADIIRVLLNASNFIRTRDAANPSGNVIPDANSAQPVTDIDGDFLKRVGVTRNDVDEFMANEGSNEIDDAMLKKLDNSVLVKYRDSDKWQLYPIGRANELADVKTGNRQLKNTTYSETYSDAPALNPRDVLEYMFVFERTGKKDFGNRQYKARLVMDGSAYTGEGAEPWKSVVYDDSFFNDNSKTDRKAKQRVADRDNRDAETAFDTTGIRSQLSYDALSLIEEEVANERKSYLESEMQKLASLRAERDESLAKLRESYESHPDWKLNPDRSNSENHVRVNLIYNEEARKIEALYDEKIAEARIFISDSAPTVDDRIAVFTDEDIAEYNKKGEDRLATPKRKKSYEPPVITENYCTLYEEGKTDEAKKNKLSELFDAIGVRDAAERDFLIFKHAIRSLNRYKLSARVLATLDPTDAQNYISRYAQADRVYTEKAKKFVNNSNFQRLVAGYNALSNKLLTKTKIPKTETQIKKITDELEVYEQIFRYALGDYADELQRELTSLDLSLTKKSTSGKNLEGTIDLSELRELAKRIAATITTDENFTSTTVSKADSYIANIKKRRGLEGKKRDLSGYAEPSNFELAESTPVDGIFTPRQEADMNRGKAVIPDEVLSLETPALQETKSNIQSIVNDENMDLAKKIEALGSMFSDGELPNGVYESLLSLMNAGYGQADVTMDEFVTALAESITDDRGMKSYFGISERALNDYYSSAFQSTGSTKYDLVRRIASVFDESELSTEDINYLLSNHSKFNLRGEALSTKEKKLVTAARKIIGKINKEGYTKSAGAELTDYIISLAGVLSGESVDVDELNAMARTEVFNRADFEAQREEKQKNIKRPKTVESEKPRIDANRHHLSYGMERYLEKLNLEERKQKAKAGYVYDSTGTEINAKVAEELKLSSLDNKVGYDREDKSVIKFYTRNDAGMVDTPWGPAYVLSTSGATDGTYSKGVVYAYAENPFNADTDILTDGKMPTFLKKLSAISPEAYAVMTPQEIEAWVNGKTADAIMEFAGRVAAIETSQDAMPEGYSELQSQLDAENKLLDEAIAARDFQSIGQIRRVINDINDQLYDLQRTFATETQNVSDETLQGITRDILDSYGYDSVKSGDEVMLFDKSGIVPANKLKFELTESNLFDSIEDMFTTLGTERIENSFGAAAEKYGTYRYGTPKQASDNSGKVSEAADTLGEQLKRMGMNVSAVLNKAQVINGYNSFFTVKDEDRIAATQTWADGLNGNWAKGYEEIAKKSKEGDFSQTTHDYVQRLMFELMSKAEAQGYLNADDTELLCKLQAQYVHIRSEAGKVLRSADMIYKLNPVAKAEAVKLQLDKLKKDIHEGFLGKGKKIRTALDDYNISPELLDGLKEAGMVEFSGGFRIASGVLNTIAEISQNDPNAMEVLKAKGITPEMLVALPDAMNALGLEVQPGVLNAGRFVKPQKMYDRQHMVQVSTDTLNVLKLLNNAVKDPAVAKAIAQYQLTEEKLKAAIGGVRYAPLGPNGVDAITGRIAEEIANNIPADWSSRIMAFRMLCMLSAPKTAIKNYVGNLTSYIMLNSKDWIKGITEDSYAKKNGMDFRTASAENSLSKSKFKEDILEFVKDDYEKTQHSISSDTSKFFDGGKIAEARNPFGESQLGQFLNKASKRTSWMLEESFFGDQKFLKKAYNHALASAMAANPEWASDYGGNIVEYFRNEALYNPNVDSVTKERNALAIERLNSLRGWAMEQALESTFRDASHLADVLKNYEQKGGIFTKLAIGALMPFKRTTINVAKRGYEYSPVNLVMTAVNGANKVGTKVGVGSTEHVYTTAEYIDDLCKGLTGTGALLIGAILGYLGVAKAGGDDDDRAEYYDQMLGNQTYSLNVGGLNLTIDALTPFVFPFMTGVEMANAVLSIKDGEDVQANLGQLGSSIIQASMTMVDPLTQLSFISGLTDAISTYSYNGIEGIISSALESYASQFVPTLLGQAARTIDPLRRTTYVPKDTDSFLGATGQKFANKMLNKIPFLSLLSDEYVDMWGREDRKFGEEGQGALESAMSDPLGFAVNAAEQFVLPTYVKKRTKTEVDDELAALYARTGDSHVLPSTPKAQFTIDSQTYYLSGPEYVEFKKTAGDVADKAIMELMNSSAYLAATDEQKLAAVKEVYSYAADMAKLEYSTKYNLGFKLSKKLGTALNRGLSVGEYYLLKEALKGAETEREKRSILASFGMTGASASLF